MRSSHPSDFFTISIETNNFLHRFQVCSDDKRLKINMVSFESVATVFSVSFNIMNKLHVEAMKASDSTSSPSCFCSQSPATAFESTSRPKGVPYKYAASVFFMRSIKAILYQFSILQRFQLRFKLKDSRFSLL